MIPEPLVGISATVNTLGNKITLEYDEDISGNTVTNNGTTGFTISGTNSAGNTLSLSNPTPVSGSPEKFTFDLSDTFYIDDEKSATNTSGINITGSGNNMEDLAGNNLGPLPAA